MKFSTKGLKTYLEVASATQVPITITGATAASPSVVSVAAIGSIVAGDIVFVAGTDLASLDDKYFIVANVVGDTFELQCSDASAEAGAATGGTVSRFVSGTDYVPFCINALSRDVPAGDVVDLGTFCDPQAQSSAERTSEGTLSWGGPIDYCDLGFIEMQKALSDNVQRVFIVEFPQNIGYMFVPITVNSYSEEFGFRGAATWTGGGVVETAPQLRTCAACA